MRAPAGQQRPGTADLAIVAVVVAGAAISVQARLNGALQQDVGVWRASLVSFAVGMLALLALTAGSARRRAALARLRASPGRAWYYLGGLGGAALVAGATAAVPIVGVAFTQVLLVAGQTVGGLGVDRAGLVPGGTHAVTRQRLLGAAIVVGAVAVAGLGHYRDVHAGLFTALVAAGLMASVQQAANGHLRHRSGDAVAASVVNFGVGGLALVAVAVGTAAVAGLPAAHWPAEPLLYLGGLGGALFVAVTASVVQRLGVLRLSLAAVSGQLVGAVLVDLVAPAHGHGLTVATVVGVVLTFVGVAVAGRGRQRAGDGG